MTIASGYLPGYLPILIMMVLGVILAATFSCIGLFLGPKLRGEAKETPFESGFLKDGMEGHRYDVKFYMTALVFLIFDVEVVFLYPWSVQIRELGWFGFLASSVFLGILILGLAYDWKKGALEWE
jgi:NADH-quinone oxidoreductase subunit A